jgi:D-arabinose 1-dehydrogenase-like Zn-dependent alcohol dehydrogenase
MKAVQLVEIGKPLELREVARPEPGPGEIRVNVVAAGVCHSDAHYRAGIASVGFLPITLGHEIAGVVEKIGASVDDASIGDRPIDPAHGAPEQQLRDTTRGRGVDVALEFARTRSVIAVG